VSLIYIRRGRKSYFAPIALSSYFDRRRENVSGCFQKRHIAVAQTLRTSVSSMRTKNQTISVKTHHMNVDYSA